MGVETFPHQSTGMFEKLHFSSGRDSYKVPIAFMLGLSNGGTCLVIKRLPEFFDLLTKVEMTALRLALFAGCLYGLWHYLMWMIHS
jgi:hypothetical protein